jgi:hypothetical protein
MLTYADVTAGYALDTAQVVAVCSEDTCQVSTEMLIASTAVANKVVGKTSEGSFDPSLAQHVVNILSATSTAAQPSRFYTALCPGQKPLVNVTAVSERSVLDLTIAASQRLGALLLGTKLSGEEKVTYLGTSGCFTLTYADVC